MTTQIDTAEREIVLVEDAHIRPMMGLEILEPLPSRTIPYSQVDPFILVHEGVVPATSDGERGHDAPAPWLRQPLVRDLGLVEHRATAPVPAARWSGRGWRPDRS